MLTNNIKKQLKLISVATLILSASLSGNAWADDTSINRAKEQQQLQTLLEWNKIAQAKLSIKMEKKHNIELQALANIQPKKSYYANRQLDTCKQEMTFFSAQKNNTEVTKISTTPVVETANQQHNLINL